LGIIERRLRRLPPVRAMLAVSDGYNAGGGGLFASGLAFSALFAVIPALLLIVSLLVIAVDDATTRANVIDWIITTIPPLAEVAKSVIDNLVTGAQVGTVVGLVGFIWRASGFYMALQAAMERFFPGPHAHDPVRGRLRGILAVAVVVVFALVGFLVSTGVGLLSTDLQQHLNVRWDFALTWVGPVVAVVIGVGICLAIYRLVPSDPPSRRAASIPALCAGTFIGLLTALFGLLLGILVQGVVGIGAIAGFFIALIWFNYVFQALLYGAAYARIRRDRDRVALGPPSI
jgi:membrane protein